MRQLDFSILKAFVLYIQLTSVPTSSMPINYGFLLFYICLMEFFILLMVQKVKTSVQKKNSNPIWNEVLQLSVTNPTKPVHLVSLLF